MKIFNFTKDIDIYSMNECAECIRLGGTAIFPTETVYGIGANALNFKAVEKIFKAKGRPSDNPLIVHISDFNMLDQVVDMQKVTDTETILMKSFWPGPFTIILPKKSCVPDNVTARLETVGVRMPDNLVALELIRQAGVPIAAPSANISGKPSGTDVLDIIDEIGDRVDYIIDGGKTDVGIESTVVKLVEGKVKILRPGKITKEDIEAVVGKDNVILDGKIFKKAEAQEKVESPGMKHRHYAPDAKCVLVYSDNETILLDKIKELIVDNVDKLSKICVLGYNEHKEIINKYNIEDKIQYISVGSMEDLNEISKNIFSSLRKLDKIKPDICIIEGVAKRGLGIGIMNRLIRACEYNFIEL